MSSRMPDAALSVKPATVDLGADDGSTGVDLLQLVRVAVQETGWTAEALAAHFKVSDRSYPHKLLKGDKPLSVERLAAFPNDVIVEFAERLAEACGLLVVPPEARRFFSHLLFPHARMAKASLPVGVTADRRMA